MTLIFSPVWRSPGKTTASYCSSQRYNPVAGFCARPPVRANRHVHMTSADPVISRNGSRVVRHSKFGSPMAKSAHFWQNQGSRKVRRMTAVPAVGIFAPQRRGGSARTRLSGCGRRAHQFRDHLVGAKNVLLCSIPPLSEGVLRRAYQPSSGLFEAPRKSQRSTNRIAACHSLQ